MPLRLLSKRLGLRRLFLIKKSTRVSRNKVEPSPTHIFQVVDPIPFQVSQVTQVLEQSILMLRAPSLARVQVPVPAVLRHHGLYRTRKPPISALRRYIRLALDLTLQEILDMLQAGEAPPQLVFREYLETLEVTLILEIREAQLQSLLALLVYQQDQAAATTLVLEDALQVQVLAFFRDLVESLT